MDAWIAPLSAGNAEEAWDLFIGQYRRLIFATIRRYTTDPDDVMDVFAHVCEAVRANEFARLRRYAERFDPRRSFGTLLCAAVYNLMIDWVRARQGRERVNAFVERLSPIQRRIFELVFMRGHSHVEAYELLRTGDYAALTFAEFRGELRSTYRAAGATQRGRLVQELDPAPLAGDEPAADMEADPAAASERRSVLHEAMQSLPAQDRLVIQLYVIDGVPAEEVARLTGLPSAKAVYNRVYRGLATIRGRLQQAGIGVGDL